MDRFKDQRRPKYNSKESPNEDDDHSLEEEDGGTPEPFGGAKVRRKAFRYREHSGDYLHSSLIDEDSRETRLALLHSHRWFLIWLSRTDRSVNCNVCRGHVDSIH